MKIAHVCPFYTPAIGGVKQVVEELAKRQVHAGHEVHVFTSDWDKEKRIPEQEEIIDGVHVHRCTHIARVANFATIWPTGFTQLLREDLDVIHSHVFGHAHFVFAGIAAQLKGIPHVHTTHCPWTDAFRSTVGRLGLLASYHGASRVALSMTDKIIAITPWENDFIKSHGGRDEQIMVLPNGMSNLFFSKIKNNNFKKSLGIKNNLILFFGRLNVTKGPEKFVEIAHELLKKRDDVTFVIRGPDEGMRDIVKQKIGNEKRIILLDASRDRHEIVQMYQAADVFVLPSFREGLPLTLFEAMASGAPIVASPVNGIPYEMKEPENGFLVQYGNNKKFVERIEQLLDDKNLRTKIAQTNVLQSEQYRWDLIAVKTMQLYRDLILRRIRNVRPIKTSLPQPTGKTRTAMHA